MPITPTTNLSLNMYDDGDNAGAGVTYSSAPTNTGLNGNWHKLDALVGGITTTAGVILPNKVTTSTIDTAAVTDTKLANNSVVAFKIAPAAIETNTMNINGSGQLQVKSLGIDTAQLKDNAVTSTKILDGAVTSGKLATDSVTDGKIADNIPKLKQNFVFSRTTGGAGFLNAGIVTTSNSIGIPMIRGGSITGLSYFSTGTNTPTYVSYSISGSNHFNVGQYLSVTTIGDQPPYSVQVLISGANPISVAITPPQGVSPIIVNVEVEYD